MTVAGSKLLAAMSRQDDQKRVERFMLDRFIDWAGLDCAEVKEGVPPAPDYFLTRAQATASESN